MRVFVGVEDSPDPMKLGIGVGSRSGVPWVLAHFTIVLKLLVSIGIAGTTANGHFFGIGFSTPNFYFQEQRVSLLP